MKRVTKMPRFWMMKRSQKDSLDRSWWRFFGFGCIFWAAWRSVPLLLLPVLTLPPLTGCSSSTIIGTALF